MISVIIPTLNAQNGLVATLAALVPATVDGVVREVIIVDGGSNDATIAIAEAAGAGVLITSRGRGEQLTAGGAAAKHDWLLFLHADTVLEAGWHEEVAALIDAVRAGARPATAAAFQYALNDDGLIPRLMERGVRLRCALFRLPYGDQGLLIPRALYDELGGYRPLQLFEDVDIVRRTGRRRLKMLESKAMTSAVRYQRDGYARRIWRNLACLAMYYMQVPTDRIARFYNG